MYKCLDNFSSFSGKYFKGGVYKDLPSEKIYHNRFVKIEAKESKEIHNRKVETASVNPGEKRKRRRK